MKFEVSFFGMGSSVFFPNLNDDEYFPCGGRRSFRVFVLGFVSSLGEAPLLVLLLLL
jgi:hypothetical protein